MLRRSLICTALLVVFIAALFLANLPGEQAAEAASPIPDSLLLPSEVYWVGLPVDALDPADVPAGMLPDQAETTARQLLQKQASPILDQLEELQMRGEISDFALEPDKHAIRVAGMDNSSALDSLQTPIFVAADAIPECHTGAAAAWQTQVMGLSQAASAEKMRLNQVNAADTNPSIEVQYTPGSSWGNISGVTDPGVTVTVRILRQGQVVVERTAFSSTFDGRYYVYPYYYSCPTSGYDFELQAGDVVEVTAAGNTVSTTVVDIYASVNRNVSRVLRHQN